jgi:hypothetical protein
MMEQRDASYDLMIGKAETRVRLLNYFEKLNIWRAHMRNHGRGIARWSSITQMLLNRLSLYMSVSGYVIIFEYLI